MFGVGKPCWLVVTGDLSTKNDDGKFKAANVHRAVVTGRDEKKGTITVMRERWRDERMGNLPAFNYDEARAAVVRHLLLTVRWAMMRRWK